MKKTLVLALLMAGWTAAQEIPKDAVLPTETRYLTSPSASQFPNSNAVFLSDVVKFSVSPEGATVYDEHDVIKVFTPAGVEEHKELVRIYRADQEKVEVVQARTILPDGRVLEIPSQAITDEPVFDKGESRLNESMRRVVVRFPAVTPNCIVEFHTKTSKKPMAGGKWWAVSYVQNSDPMVESTFIVEVPAGSPWRYASPGYPDLQPERVSIDGFERATWKISQSPALQQEVVAPAVLLQMKRIEVSNFESWSALRSWFESNFAAVSEADSAAIEQVKKLSGAGGSAENELVDIGTWASKKRVLSGSFDEFRPNKAATLMEEKVMTGLDGAVLLAALYRAAGFTVTPVLAFELPPEDMKSALPRFNRVDNILLRVSRGGQSWWIEPNRPLEFSSYPPSGLQAGSALTASSEEQPFESLASSSADDNRVVTQAEGRVDERGKLELRFNTTEHGASATLYREASRDLLESDKDLRDQKLQRLFDRIAEGYGQRARVLDHYFSLQPKQGEPIDFAATIAVPDYALRLNNQMILPMPMRLNPQLLGLANSEGPRTQPVRLDHPWREEFRLRLHVPDNAMVSELPPTVNIRSPYGSFFATARAEGKQVYYYARLIMDKAWVPQEQSAELTQFARQVVQGRGRLLLTPSTKTSAALPR